MCVCVPDACMPAYMRCARQCKCASVANITIEIAKTTKNRLKFHSITGICILVCVSLR